MCICIIKNKTTIFKCNCYVNQSERVNKKYCNGRMHAVLKKKSPTVVCLAESKNKTKTTTKRDKNQTNKNKAGVKPRTCQSPIPVMTTPDRA